MKKNLRVSKITKLLEFSVKSGKHNTRTLSLVQKRWDFFKNLQKSTLAFKRGRGRGELSNAPSFFFRYKLSFILFWSPLSFFLSASTAARYYTFTAPPTCTTTIITLEPCALSAEFQHFIPRFNQISLPLRTWLKEGDRGGERRPKDSYKLSFILFWSPLSFFLSASTAARYYTFTDPPTCTTTIITLEPCALNAEFQHFIPRFNKISLLCWPDSKRGIGGWKETQRQGEDRMAVMKTLLLADSKM